jgi:hypothetical protein
MGSTQISVRGFWVCFPGLECLGCDIDHSPSVALTTRTFLSGIYVLLLMQSNYRCALREGVRWSDVGVSSMLKLGTRYRWVCMFIVRLLYFRKKISRYPLGRKLGRSQSGFQHLDKETNFSFLPGIGIVTSIP